eukprot:gene40906-55283_t
MLIRVEQPTDEIYLRIAATKTFLGRGRTSWTPPRTRTLAADEAPRILATTDVPLNFIGHGAANRIIGPLRPVLKDGAAYIALDFAEIPQQFVPNRRGLQSLYNTDIPLDSRLLVAYGRDISALSAAQVAALPRPTRLGDFPRDLILARGLEFSGIYEDGWLSPQSEFTLGRPAASTVVRLRGYIPELPGTKLGTGQLNLTIDGRAFTLPAVTGTFDWLLPLAPAVATAHTTHLGLTFTATGSLTAGDDRPVGANLTLLEVLPALPGKTYDFATAGAIRPAALGIDQDGWMARSSTLELPVLATATDLVLKIEFPDWNGGQPTTLRTSLSDGSPSVEHPLLPGQYATLRLRVAPSATPRTLRLDAAADFPLPAPDTRRRAARLLQLDLVAP